MNLSISSLNYSPRPKVLTFKSHNPYRVERNSTYYPGKYAVKPGHLKKLKKFLKQAEKFFYNLKYKLANLNSAKAPWPKPPLRFVPNFSELLF